VRGLSAYSFAVVINARSRPAARAAMEDDDDDDDDDDD
jgi:hypothetical protein